MTSGPVPSRRADAGTGRHLALLRDGPDLAVVARRPRPGPAIRVLRAGVCGTDLDILRGARPDAAVVLGHEGLGEITGRGGTARRVVFNPVDPANQDRILGHTYAGIFQQRVVEPRARVVDASPELPLDLGPLVEPLAVARYAWRLLARDRPPRTVGIWGAGTAAVLSAIVAQQQGAEVHLFHDRIERLDWLRARGMLGEAVPHLIPHTRPPEVEAAVLCTPRAGFSEALSQALRCLLPGGVIDFYGGVAPGSRHEGLPGVDLSAVRRRNVCGMPAGGDHQPARTATGKQVWLVGHRGSADAELLLAQAALAADAGLFGRVISHVVSLEQAARMMPRMLRRGGSAQEEVLKVVIDLWMERPRREVCLTPAPATSSGGV